MNPSTLRHPMAAARNPIPRRLRLAPLALACLAAVAHADTPDTLDRIVVEGEAPALLAPLDLERARQRLDERPGATHLITEADLREGRAAHLADALRTAPGVVAQPRFGADEARVSIRGSGLQRTFHGRGLMLLQDGAPINLADGSFDMQSVEALAARYVQVWRGASALEYGAASLGGAIDFVSLTGRDVDGVGGRVEAGSFGQTRGQAMAGTAGGAWDGFASLTASVQDGYRDNARQETWRLFSNLGLDLGAGARARLFLTRVDSRSALPGALTLAQFREDPRQANASSVALDQRRDFVMDRIGLQFAGQAGAQGEWSVSAFHARKDLDHPIFQVLIVDTRDSGLDLRWRHGGGEGRRLLQAGIGFVEGDTLDERFVNLGRGPSALRRGPRTALSDQTARTLSGFVELQQPVGPRTTVVAGTHWAEASRRSRDLFQAAGVDRSFQRSYRQLSPKLGLRHGLADGVEAYGNLSRSFEPPSFGELAGGPGITLVDAQRADTVELGVRGRLSTLELDAAVYRGRLRNQLLALNDDQGNPLGTVNAGRTLHQGLELGARWRFATQASLRATALVNDFRFRDDPVYGNNRLAGLPRSQLRLGPRWQVAGNLWVEPELEWAPQSMFVDHANTFRVPGYRLLNLRAGGDVGTGWRWFAEARNLTDRAWIATTGVVADARGLDGAYVLPGDGRSLHLGLEWRP